jgi:hypothetical protein
MTQLEKLTRDKIDKFFDSETTTSSLEYAKKRLDERLLEYSYKVSDDFGYYLKDEFRLFYADLVKNEVTRVVQQILLGNNSIMEEYNLAPADWGLRCDPYQIRSKIVEDHAEMIRNTYIMSLEDELKRTKQILEITRGY